MHCVFNLDPSGRVTDANAALLELLALPLSDIVGRPLTGLNIFAADTSRLAEQARSVVASGVPIVDAAYTRTQGANAQRFECSLLPVQGSGHRVESLVALLRDVTDRSNAEAALRRSADHLQAIFSGTHEYFGVMALDGTLLEANRESLEFAPELLTDAIGQKFWDTAWFAYTPGMPEMVREAVGAAAAGHPIREEVFLLHPSGERRDFDFSLHPVRDGSGQVVLIVPEGRDITERKRAEAGQRDLAAQLLQSQKLESIGTLAGGIAHDFNNILAAILGNVSLARFELDAHHPVQKRLEQIRSSSMRARELVQQILTFGRRGSQERTVQTLRPLIDETLAILRSTLPAAVGFTTEFIDQPLHVRVNAMQIQQVLMNVGTNAWHALPDGTGGQITLGLDVSEFSADDALRPPALRSGRYAHLWVRDTGTGMDEATLARIFEPFFTTKPVGRGTGLGLSVVHGIVTEHQGAISVVSQPGRGTTVSMHFPLLEGGSGPVTPAPALDAATAHHSDGCGAHIVYIDDDPMMSVVAEGLLSRKGYRVTTFCDASAALTAIEANAADIDLVVTDYNMPRLSGLDVVRRLREIRPALPAMMTSGHIDDELRVRASGLGVTHLLNKENSAEQLSEVVARALGTRH